MRDLERAMLDIAEVRERLAMTQRFRGYSGVAAAASGCFAIIAGVVQALLAPAPATSEEHRLYAAVWLACGGAALIVNYAAIAHWFVSDASARDRWQTRTVGLSILPALMLGAALTATLIDANRFGLLPGIWCACYGVGLFASRTLVPREVVLVAALFMLAGISLLFTPSSIALSWWILPLAFGAGQIAIGVFVARDHGAQV
jgi:uncharacterized membrane protein